MGVLRYLARWLVRGDRAQDVREDIDELFERDLERGISPPRARGRYAKNVLGSAASAGQARMAAPRVPRMSWLDVKLGGRMLVKYPGLTLVGGSALAFAIAVGASVFMIVNQMVYPSLPLPDGDRVVGIVNWDAETNDPVFRSVHDFETWRDEVTTIEGIGAARLVSRNLIVDGAPLAPVQAAEISPSAFGVARIPALMGRTLQPSDGESGAPVVAVIGYDLWRARFSGDLDVVGRVVQLGDVSTTIVGVMPEGFGFPVAENVWIALQARALDVPRGEGPRLHVFGRLAPGSSLEDAQAELTAIGARTAAAYPATHELLRPRVLPYVRSILDVPAAIAMALYSFNLLAIMFAVLISANVALLLFARASTRTTELVIRTALGAGRGRIVMQLFAEALVLGAVAATVGLIAAAFGARWAVSTFAAVEGTSIPFWFKAGLDAQTILYTVLLTMLGAAIAGILPALKATGRRTQAAMQQAAAGGPAVRFGGVWTAVIMTQIALTVVFVPLVVFAGFDIAEIRTSDLGYPADEFLSVRLRLDENAGSFLPAGPDQSQREMLADSFLELRRRLAEEPAVRAVTFATQFPGGYHQRRWVEIEGETEAPRYAAGHRPQGIDVDVGYFDALGAGIVAGRGFHQSDLDSGAPVVVVNEAFVEDILGGRNAVGRRMRYITQDDGGAPWFEIVGVVEQLAMTIDPDLPSAAGFYRPAGPADLRTLRVGLHVAGDPLALAPRLRQVAAEADPNMRLDDIQTLDQAAWATLRTYEFWFQVALAAIGLALLLALAGIYAIMSFTVAQRTREIGVRVALGAARRDVVVAVLKRSAAQVAGGVLLGMALVFSLIFATAETSTGLTPTVLVYLAAYAVGMVGVCLLASIVPTRRALRVEPTEALRAD